MAALVGGFALGNLQKPSDFSDGIAVGIYLLAFMAVHACTCSAVTSAFVYRTVNQMEDQHVESWAKKHSLMLALPMMKFVMGTIAYMASVILISWRDLGEAPMWQMVTLGVGVMSMGSVMGVSFLIERSVKAYNKIAVDAANEMVQIRRECRLSKLGRILSMHCTLHVKKKVADPSLKKNFR